MSKFTMVIGGDFIPTADNAERLERGEVESTFGDVAEYFKNADFSFINVEGALTQRGEPIEKAGPNLRGNPVTAEVLKKIGVNVCGFSNNHSLDFGKAGLLDSIETVKKYGMDYVGAGENLKEARKPYYFEVNGVPAALIAVAEHEFTIADDKRAGANPFDPFDTIEDIENAAKDGRKVIVIYHGGKEHYDMTSPMTRRRLRKMAEHGADFIFAQHTHCVCCHEEYMGSQICYGQANTLFAKYLDHPMWRYGILPIITVGEKNKVEYIPFTVENGKLSIAHGKAAEDIMRPFEERSRLLHDEEYFSRRWEEFYMADGEARFKRLGIVNEDGSVPYPQHLTSLSNNMCAEIHYEVCTDYLTQKRRLIHGGLRVDGE